MIPKQLIKSIANKGCILLVGSGLSRHTAQLPLWSEFVGKIRDDMPDDQESSGATDDNIANYKLEYLEYAKKNFASEFQESVENQLRNNNKRYVNNTYDVIAKIPWEAIITTNLDTLIEDAFDELNKDYILVSDRKSIVTLGNKKGTIILKMHGVLNPDNQVLTLSEYLDYDENHQALKALLISLFSQYPVLIVGLGLADQNFIKLYDKIHSLYGGFKHTGFYVYRELPKFVREVWEVKKLKFIPVDYNDITKWLVNVKDAVKTEKLSDRNRNQSAINAYMKHNSLIELGEVLYDYRKLQDKYTAHIQIPDYLLFDRAWEQSLYIPLRKHLSKSLQHLHKASDYSLAYFGPGPHVPLFHEMNNFISKTLKKVLLIDLTKGLLKEAKQNTIQKFKEFSGRANTEIESLEMDITGGIGAVFSEFLSNLLKNNATIEDIFKMVSNVEQLEIQILSSENIINAENKLSEISKDYYNKFSITYSEMLVAFTGTASLMAFRSRLFKKFPKDENSTYAPSHVMEKLIDFWKIYNQKIHHLHLRNMSKMTKKGGLVIVAVDTEKIFDDSKISSLISYPNVTPPNPNITNLKEVPELRSNPIFWRDHEYRFDISIAGYSVNDFYPHKHRVYILTYKKE